MYNLRYLKLTSLDIRYLPIYSLPNYVVIVICNYCLFTLIFTYKYISLIATVYMYN